MRICLTTTSYPPESYGGIPRQRQVLANALVEQGHEVHVIVQGKRQQTYIQNRVLIHTVPFLKQPIVFSEKYPALNYRLTHSLAIQEQVRDLNREKRMDVLDAPLWGLEGFIPIYANEMPVVLWLQTSFAQIFALDQQTPQADDLGIIGLEKECLRRARGVIADSSTVLADFENLYGLSGMRERSRVIHLGLPDLPPTQQAANRKGEAIEALVVGRLEKRKGTPFLFEILPDLLKSDPRLRLRFVGQDNSRWDGFQAEHGSTYPAYFRRNYPGLQGRVIFEGQVSERRLVEAYNQADLMLVPSQYESFGLIYLEAMRAGLPILTFALSAAPEIFPRGGEDGAILIPSQDNQAFITAALELAEDKKKRRDIGKCGRERFIQSFLDTRMAEKTAEYYREVAQAHSRTAIARPRRIFQVMEALDSGDAVSTIALRNAILLQRMGAGGTVLSLHAHPELAGKSRPVGQFDIDSNSALIFHYWNFSYLENFIRSFPGLKAIHFHNITPPEYFSPGSPGHTATSRGYEQLPAILHLFDLLIGDSAFNLEACQPFLAAPKPGIVVPPWIEAEEIHARPYDVQLLKKLKQQPGMKILFVGRIARNKRQDRLIELLAELSRPGGPRPWLYLVGSDQGDPDYGAELETLGARLAVKNRLVLTGKVSSEALYSYYRAADVFVSASEHEGFGLPVVEAMALDLPVLAYAAGAVPETMGEAGVLVREWEARAVAGEVRRLVSDTAWRQEVLAGQRQNLRRFGEETVMERLTAVVRFLQDDESEEGLIGYYKR
jgi:glycosyltransferase involved in cell wall biosynthesis